MNKAILFTLMLVTGFFGIKSCKKSFNYEGTKTKTIQATVLDKYMEEGKDGMYTYKMYRIAVVRPHINNPRVIDTIINDDLYYKINKGDKITISEPLYKLTYNADDGFAYSFFGFILVCLSLYFLLGVVVVDND